MMNSHLVIVKLDDSALTTELINRIQATVTEKCNTFKISIDEKDFKSFRDFSIVDLSKSTTKPLSTLSPVIIQQKNKGTFRVDLPDLRICVIDLSGWVDFKAESVFGACCCNVLIFVGHTVMGSMMLSPVLTVPVVKQIIDLCDPDVVAFFGCDIGRPRDGFLYDMSHSYQLLTGPVFCAFWRKVTADEILSSATLGGIAMFLKRVRSSGRSGAHGERDKSKLYNCARICFALAIIKFNPPSFHDMGMFFNDTRKETTLQRCLILMKSGKVANAGGGLTLGHYAQYHMLTAGPEGAAPCKAFVSKLSSAAGVSPAEIEAEYARVKLQGILELHQAIHYAAKIDQKNMALLSAGDWGAVPVEMFCSAMHSGLVGRLTNQEVISELLQRLVAASSRETAFMILATILFLNESWHVSLNVREDLDLVLGQQGDWVTSEIVCCGWHRTHRKIAHNLPPSVLQVTLRPPFEIEDFLGADFAGIYDLHCKAIHDFVDLHAGGRAHVVLQNYQSIAQLREFETTVRATYDYSKSDLEFSLSLMCDLMVYVHNELPNYGARYEFIHKDLKKCEVGESPWSPSPLRNGKKFGMEFFDHDAKGGAGNNRIPTFKKIHKVLKEMLFLEMKCVPADKNVDRCRFVVGFSKSFLNNFEGIGPDFVGHLFYSDIHHGQDMYLLARKDDGAYHVEEEDFVTGNWINDTTYLQKTVAVAKTERLFAYSYCGRVKFNTAVTEPPIQPTLEFIYRQENPEEPVIPTFVDSLV